MGDDFIYQVENKRKSRIWRELYTDITNNDLEEKAFKNKYHFVCHIKKTRFGNGSILFGKRYKLKR